MGFDPLIKSNYLFFSTLKNMDEQLSNKYYLYLHRGQKPVLWYPPDPHPLHWVDFTYFGKVFEAMEKSLKISGLVFYLTWDSVDELPSYGSNVVAVVVGDEWCRIPKYYHKVLAIFKCYGTQPILGCNPFIKPSYLNFLTLIQFFKVTLHRLPGWINHEFHELQYLKRTSNKKNSIYDIPLGYARQLKMPIKDIKERKYDIFFAGSIDHAKYPMWSLKHWFSNPKSISRNKMIASLKKLQIEHPELRIELGITSSFWHSKDGDNDNSYSQKMMDTKVCLVPRGTSFETFRFFEAMRYGCIVVGEVLPQRWFYEGSPAILINDWSELEIILPKLLENMTLIQDKHQKSLTWWKTKCSEAVVGDYIAKKVNLLASISEI